MRPASANFFLADSYVGRDFLQSWTWETFDDPTHGRVNYLDQATALASNLTFGASHSLPIVFGAYDADLGLPPSLG